MNYATLGPVSVYLPAKIETADELKELYPDWNMDAIHEKTGIYSRYIAAADEFCSDMATRAAENLFAEYKIDRSKIDFILLCTQTPDYPIPTTACLVQHRLGLDKECGALDFNLGCSGYVYGLSLADGLIRTGVGKNILLITSETYTKYIDSEDRSLRTIFSDAATASLITASEEATLGPFHFGTDGSGADMLIAYGRGSRPEELSIKPRHRKRWKSSLYMDGSELIKFTNLAIPQLVRKLLHKADLTLPEVDLFLMHQATRKMIDGLSETLALPPEKVPIEMEHYGNTVSSTLPILIHNLRKHGEQTRGKYSMLLGFGVGLSWGGCIWKDSWDETGY